MEACVSQWKGGRDLARERKQLENEEDNEGMVYCDEYLNDESPPRTNTASNSISENELATYSLNPMNAFNALNTLNTINVTNNNNNLNNTSINNNNNNNIANNDAESLIAAQLQQALASQVAEQQLQAQLQQRRQQQQQQQQQQQVDLQGQSQQECVETYRHASIHPKDAAAAAAAAAGVTSSNATMLMQLMQQRQQQAQQEELQRQLMGFNSISGTGTDGSISSSGQHEPMITSSNIHRARITTSTMDSLSHNTMNAISQPTTSIAAQVIQLLESNNIAAQQQSQLQQSQLQQMQLQQQQQGGGVLMEELNTSEEAGARQEPIVPSLEMTDSTSNSNSMTNNNVSILKPLQLKNIIRKRGDNENGDLLIHQNDGFGENQRYIAMEMLGKGTFGQVVKCFDRGTNKCIALKVIRNKPAYHTQAKVEIKILKLLEQVCDKSKHRGIINLESYFEHENHLCLVFPLMHINLFQLMKNNEYAGFTVTAIRVFVIQLLQTLAVLKEAKVVHTDLKPENILLEPTDGRTSNMKIKVIDFGSACMAGETPYSYIQSRFYRAPEIVIGCRYGHAIDMWSLGCIAAELSLGLPLFPGKNECTLLHRIVGLLYDIPQNMLEKGRRTSKFYHKITEPSNAFDGKTVIRYKLKTPEEYTGETNFHMRQYFIGDSLPEVIIKRRQPSLQQLPDTINAGNGGVNGDKPTCQSPNEIYNRAVLADFLCKCLTIDPDLRPTPEDMLTHPLITGEPWHGYDTWQPPSLRKECELIDDNSPLSSESDKSPTSPQSQYGYQYGKQLMMNQLQSRSLPGSSLPSMTNSPNWIPNNCYPTLIHAPMSHGSSNPHNIQWNFSPPKFSNIRIMKAKCSNNFLCNLNNNNNNSNNGSNGSYGNGNVLYHRTDRSHSFSQGYSNHNSYNNHYHYNNRSGNHHHNNNHNNHNSHHHHSHHHNNHNNNNHHGHHHSHNHNNHHNNHHRNNNGSGIHSHSFTKNLSQLNPLNQTTNNTNVQSGSYPQLPKNNFLSSTQGMSGLSLLASLPPINTNLGNNNNNANNNQMTQQQCSSVASSLHQTPVTPSSHVANDAFSGTMGHLNLINDTSPDGVCSVASLSHNNSNMLMKKNMVQQTPVRPQLQQPTFPSQLIDLRNMDVSKSVHFLPQSTAFGAQSSHGHYGVSPFSLQTSPNMNAFPMSNMQMPPAMLDFIPTALAHEQFGQTQQQQQPQQQQQYNLCIRNSPQHNGMQQQPRERRSIWM